MADLRAAIQTSPQLVAEGDDAFISPFIGAEFNISDNGPACAFAFVAMNFTLNDSEVHNTGDGVLGSQTFTRNSIYLSLPPNPQALFGGVGVSAATPVIGDRVFAPTGWTSVTTSIAHTAPEQAALDDELTALIASAAGTNKILGVVITSYNYVDPNFPVDGAGFLSYTYGRAYLALR